MRPRVFGGAFQGSVTYPSLGVNTAQSMWSVTSPHVSTWGGMRHRGGAQSAPAGWTPPRRVALRRARAPSSGAPRLRVRAALSEAKGPSMCVQLSQSSTTAKRGSCPPETHDHPFFITLPFEAVATRGQSQHSGQSPPWLLFSPEVVTRCAIPGAPLHHFV